MKYLPVLTLLLFSNYTFAQTQLLLENIKTGKEKSITIGKNIGVLTESDTVVNYEGYSLNNVTDSTIVVKKVSNNLYRKYRIDDIQSVQVRNSNNESSPLSRDSSLGENAFLIEP
jgi:hypothetical protein